MFLDNEEPSTQQSGGINTAETEEERDDDSFRPHHQRCLSRMVYVGLALIDLSYQEQRSHYSLDQLARWLQQ